MRLMSLLSRRPLGCRLTLGRVAVLKQGSCIRGRCSSKIRIGLLDGCKTCHWGLVRFMTTYLQCVKNDGR